MDNTSLFTLKNINTIYLTNLVLDGISTLSSNTSLSYNVIYIYNVTNLYIENVIVKTREGNDKFIFFLIQGNHNTTINNVNV